MSKVQRKVETLKSCWYAQPKKSHGSWVHRYCVVLYGSKVNDWLVFQIET